MSIRLLVADDAPFIREIIRHATDKVGMVVVAEAVNGEEAVRLMDVHKPDVVLMDMVMPEKNGVDATKEIMEAFPQAKVIGFSTLDTNEIKQKAMAAGCIDFIVKPFEVGDLLTSISNAYHS